MKLLIKLISTSILAVVLSLPQVQAQPLGVDTIMKNGPLDKHINLVYIGDGFTLGEQDFFISKVDSTNEGFFNKIPYSNYASYFNVFAIKVASPESGIKHPRTASDCPSASDFPYANPNNYFDTRFDNYGIHRLLYPVNNTLLWSVIADHFPNYDQVLMLANTTQYGGAGGELGVGSIDPWSLEIMLHECGHSFAGLADEYWAGDGYASEKTNMTNISYATPSLVKWQQWLGVSGVGIHVHCCGGISNQWYKPNTLCLMESLGKEFCPVCRQRTIERIYELVNPIVAYSPTSISVPLTTYQDFKLTDLILPSPNTLKIKWKLNATTIAEDTDSIRVLFSELTPGTNTLIAEVIDTTFMLRVLPTFTHHINTVVWKINDDGLGIDINSTPTNVSCRVFPNPTKDKLQLSISKLPANTTTVTVHIVDILGNTRLTKEYRASNLAVEEELDLTGLEAGNYFLNVVTPEINQMIKISKL